MAFTCNIDRTGRRIRLVNGVVVLVAGLLVMFFWARETGTAIPWAISIGLILAGAFMIFEAKAGWCVLRAMGMKTPK